MSRLGKLPVAVPAGVQVKIDGSSVEIKGGKGTLRRMLPREVKAELKDGAIVISPAAETEHTGAQWGLNRMLIANMVVGVSQGYRRELDIVGVGYKAELKGKDLRVSAGYSSPVFFKARDNVTYKVENQTRIVIEGIDKELVGQTAAELRKIRTPEPYKGKGIRYVGENIRRKAGKIAGK